MLAADDVGKAADSLGDELRVFDEIRRGVDDARHENQVFGQVGISECLPLVRMTWI